MRVIRRHLLTNRLIRGIVAKQLSPLVAGEGGVLQGREPSNVTFGPAEESPKADKSTQKVSHQSVARGLGNTDKLWTL